MARFSGYTPCPKCRERGADRSGDNLANWMDGSAHCFSCGYHVPPPFQLTFINKEEDKDDKEKAVLPRDFQRSHIPAAAIKWIIQYGLPWSYWKAHCGYSEEEGRLVITVGDPIKFSQGRLIDQSLGKRKWKFYGDGHNYVEVIGATLSGEVVLVEDLISAHKVGQHVPCIPIFGTTIHDVVVAELQRLNRPVRLWLDADQYPLLPKKINRLQGLLRHPVRYIFTEKDPKECSMEQIKELTK